jgi:DNA-binding LacI/PurR family transcriptional regulator
VSSIRDLARHLNISIGTVSRALNGRSDVSAETRRRVLEAARSLSYAPNQSGRSLRQGTTNMVAFILETSRKMPLADTIFTSVLDGLREYVTGRGLDLMVLMCGAEEDSYEHLRRVVERGLADGVIICETRRHDARIDYLLKRKTPFVAFGRSLTPGDYPWIDLDFEGVAERAVERLVGLGHRKIGLAVRNDEVNYNSLFAEAFRRAMQRRRLSAKPATLFAEDGNEEGGYRLGETVLGLRDRPSALVLVHNAMTVGLYRRLIEAGLAPGRDLAIVGFQEEPSGRFLSPQLTAFRSDLGGLGARLGEALIATLPAQRGQSPAEPIRQIWPMELVAGESDGAPPPSPLWGRALSLGERQASLEKEGEGAPLAKSRSAAGAHAPAVTPSPGLPRLAPLAKANRPPPPGGRGRSRG